MFRELSRETPDVPRAIGRWANRLAAAMLSLLVCALGCVSESPTPDAYLILQPTLRGEEASVSLQLRHVESGSNLLIKAGHAGSASARVALLCDPEVLAAAEAQAPEILAQHPLDRVCCEMDGDFEDLLRRGVMAVECPGE